MAYTVSNISYDYALADLPFLSAAGQEHPVERALAEVRKQQFDNSQEPGDQSLSQWWLRSGTDWTGGAGYEYMEPISDEATSSRFHDSEGVEVFRYPGSLTLLPEPSTAGTYAAASPSAMVAAGEYPRAYFATGTTTYYLNSSGTASSCTGVSGSTKLVDAAGYTLAIYNGDIYSAQTSTTTFSSLWTTTGTADGLWYVKDRVMASKGVNLYDLDLVGGDLDAATALYTHPSTYFRWKGVFSGPKGIYAAGTDGTGTSVIYRFDLDTTGALPTLSGGAVTVGQLPPNEQLVGAWSYLDTYLVLITSYGVRIGTISADGSITYGPLSYEVTPGSTLFYSTAGSYGDVSFYDRFALVPVSGTSNPGFVKFDLSGLDQDGRAPYANDVRTNVTASSPFNFRALAWGHDQYAMLTYISSGSSTVLSRTTGSYVSSGYLRTGYVRFNTLEKKYWSSASISWRKASTGSTGDAVSFQWYVPYNSAAVGSVTSVTSDTFTALSTTYNEVALGLKITLTKGTSGVLKVDGWQMRALPVVDRQELLRYPLLCFDFEKDKSGVQRGYEGSAYARYGALRDAVADGSPVTWQDLNTGETLTVIVESLTFSQEAPPANASGFGGIATVTMRTV